MAGTVLLGGCVAKGYDSSEAKQVENTGKEKAEACLNTYETDGEILSASAIAESPGRPIGRRTA